MVFVRLRLPNGAGNGAARNSPMPHRAKTPTTPQMKPRKNKKESGGCRPKKSKKAVKPNDIDGEYRPHLVDHSLSIFLRNISKFLSLFPYLSPLMKDFVQNSDYWIINL